MKNYKTKEFVKLPIEDYLKLKQFKRAFNRVWKIFKDCSCPAMKLNFYYILSKKYKCSECHLKTDRVKRAKNCWCRYRKELFK